MTCIECGRWMPADLETGYDADRYCSAACEAIADVRAPSHGDHDVVTDGISYGGHYLPPVHADEIHEAHDRLDRYGIVRESGDDEMPPHVVLTVAERIDRLARGLRRASQQAVDEGTQDRAQRDAVIRLAKEATNGWACYATRRLEHDEIARLHRAIAEAVRRP